MYAKKFTKTIENFTCKHCRTYIKGSGYTNHCPCCLYSQHVDVNPGDRKAKCGGMMEPVGVELKHGEYVITHQCTKCGYKKRNKTDKNDNIDEIIRIMSIPK